MFVQKYEKIFLIFREKKFFSLRREDMHSVHS